MISTAWEFAEPHVRGAGLGSIGDMSGGAPGAVAGWSAMAVPSLLVLLLFLLFGFSASAQHHGVRSVLLSSAALLVLATIPISTATISCNWERVAHSPIGRSPAAMESS